MVNQKVYNLLISFFKNIVKRLHKLTYKKYMSLER